MRRKIDLSLLAGTVFAGFTAMAGAAGLPRVEAHIHYSHDAWEVLSPMPESASFMPTGNRSKCRSIVKACW